MLGKIPCVFRMHFTHHKKLQLWSDVLKASESVSQNDLHKELYHKQMQNLGFHLPCA